MAEKKLAELELEARSRSADSRSGFGHRVGRLGPGEISVVVAVRSPHRHDSFDACRWLIDSLKALVPIWKKSITPMAARNGSIPAWTDLVSPILPLSLRTRATEWQVRIDM